MNIVLTGQSGMFISDGKTAKNTCQSERVPT